MIYNVVVELSDHSQGCRTSFLVHHAKVYVRLFGINFILLFNYFILYICTYVHAYMCVLCILLSSIGFNIILANLTEDFKIKLNRKYLYYYCRKWHRL